LDEAFLDVTGAIRLFGPPAGIAAAILEIIAAELRLSCSVGVASVKFLAKLASEAAKPRVARSGAEPGPGVFVVEPGTELEFLHPHPIEALWGVGPATARRLRELGFSTIGDLARVDPEVLVRAVGRAHGSHLAELARGVDDREVQPNREVKSVSHEETYPTDRRDPDGLHVEVVRMADAVATRLRRAAVAGRTVTLKIRYGDFATRTRSVTAPAVLDTGPQIAALATELLAGLDLAAGVRLLGVGVSNLVPAGAVTAEQLVLDLQSGPGPPAGILADPTPAGRRAAGSTSAAVDAIRQRFGPGAVGPAALLGPAGLRVKRPGDTQWGPQVEATWMRSPTAPRGGR
jgi:DNA polymerase-4